MENEDSFDVEGFVDEGLMASGQEPETEEMQTESDYEPDRQYEPEDEYDSDRQYDDDADAVQDDDFELQDESEDDTEEILEADDSEQDMHQGRVPLEQHIKLRKRAQQAEARALEAERRLMNQTRTDGGHSGLIDPLAEFADDDLVRAGHVRQALSKAVESAVSQANQRQQEQQQAEQAAAWALESEQYARNINPDYDQVTNAANKLGLISDRDRMMIFADENPAQKFYELSKQKLHQIQETLGIRPATSGNTTYEETGEDEEDGPVEDDILYEIFGQ